MKVSRRLPIGVQNFEVLRNNGCIYVDKTKLIFKITDGGRFYFLSRPRRFGKSLLLSTFDAYFSGKKELFTGLAIEKLENAKGKDAWQEHPIFYFDLNVGNYETREVLENKLNSHLVKWEKLYDKHEEEKTFGERFLGCIQRAYEKTGKQVVVLIDEYDKPLLQTLTNEKLNDEFRGVLKGFYSVIKSADKYLRFAFLTGVTKFSKVSIFSDLNNLNDISQKPDYAEICGITQTELEENFQNEIKLLAEHNDITYAECLAQLKQKYDGYCFSPGTKNLYNPFSLLNVFDGKMFEYYWFETGTPTFLVKYLRDGAYNIPKMDGDLQIDSAGLASWKINQFLPIPILFQAGYLTIKDYNREYKLYRLGFPNDEVRYSFLKVLMPAYTPIGYEQTGVSIMEFVENIRAGEVDAFMEKMQSLISGIPYDNLSEKDLKLRELNYQTAVYLVFALMGQFCETEVRCATGRADCVVQLTDKIYVFEFKLDGRGSAEDAIAQIKQKNYADKFKASGKKIILVGSSFDEKARTIRDWKKETC